MSKCRDENCYNECLNLHLHYYCSTFYSSESQIKKKKSSLDLEGLKLNGAFYNREVE